MSGNVGFNVHNQAGKQGPSGDLQLQIQQVNLTFKGSSFDSLVIDLNSPNGPEARFQGTGTINGSGSYCFRVTTRDLGSPLADYFRIRIWADGQGCPMAWDATTPAPLYDFTVAFGGGGNGITIH
jgi:hypothetical protein